VTLFVRNVRRTVLVSIIGLAAIAAAVGVAPDSTLRGDAAHAEAASVLVPPPEAMGAASVRSGGSAVRIAPPQPEFATQQTAGIPAGTSLRPWAWALSTSAATGVPTEQKNGMTCLVFDSYQVSLSGSQALRVDSPCVIFRRSRFVTSGDTHVMVTAAPNSKYLEVAYSDFDGGPWHTRGIQSDYASMYIHHSEFVRFGNAAVEMNNRSGLSTMTVEHNYMYEPKGWQKAAHADGIQMSAGGGAFISHNTIVIELFGGSVGDYSYVSNSAIGIGTSLGNIGTVAISHNLIAGGGYVIYVQDKEYSFSGSVSITNNVFSRQLSPTSGIWGPLFPRDVAPGIVWTNNRWDTGVAISLQQALSF
jgi:hypothetical protein